MRNLFIFSYHFPFSEKWMKEKLEKKEQRRRQDLQNPRERNILSLKVSKKVWGFLFIFIFRTFVTFSTTHDNSGEGKVRKTKLFIHLRKLNFVFVSYYAQLMCSLVYTHNTGEFMYMKKFCDVKWNNLWVQLYNKWVAEMIRPSTTTSNKKF